MKKKNRSNQRYSSSVTFKNWGRKGYSLFQVVRKVVLIAVLPVTYHLSADAARPQIVTDTTGVNLKYEVDEIEISALKSPVVFSQVARIVRVIESNEINASPVESVQELLEYVQSIDVRQRGGQGVQADISLRGSSFDQVLILLNGVDITDPQTGHHNLNLPVHLSEIQRVEIIEGPASRVFGPNAFAGAINFITKEPGQNKISFNSTLGEHGYMDGSFSIAADAKTAGQLISFGRKSSKGYQPNTDFEMYDIYYRLDAGAQRNFNYQLGYTTKAFGANSFYTPKYPNQFEETKTIFNSLQLNTNTVIHFKPSLFWRRHFDRFELFRNEAPSWYSSHNYHRTDVVGLNLGGWIKNGNGKTGFGTNFRSEKILSNVLGEELAYSVEVKKSGAQYTRSASRRIASLFLDQSIFAGRWSFSAGIMANKISGKKGINFFPGIDVSYSLINNLKIYFSANRSLRMPTFTDLYYNSPTNTGNPELNPETSSAFETGLKYQSGVLKGHFTFFYRNGENIIDWVRLEGEEKWHTQNHTRLISSGVEVSFDFFPANELESYISKISVGYIYNNLNKAESEYISNYVLDNLKHKLNFAVTHTVTHNLSAKWNFLFQDRNGGYSVFENGAYSKDKPYDPFSLVDFKINYQYKSYNLFFMMTNVFDVSYFDYGNISQPGRWIKLGIRADVGYK